MDSMKRQKDIMLQDESPRLEGVQYATMVKWREITNSSSKNEVAGPKPEWCLAGDMPGGGRKVRCCKEHYCIGSWNVRPTNQGKLDMVKQEIVRVNINILGISEL